MQKQMMTIFEKFVNTNQSPGNFWQNRKNSKGKSQVVKQVYYVPAGTDDKGTKSKKLKALFRFRADDLLYGAEDCCKLPVLPKCNQ